MTYNTDDSNDLGKKYSIKKQKLKIEGLQVELEYQKEILSILEEDKK